MEVGVLVGGRGCQCGAVRAGVRLATVRWCRLHRSSATDAQNQTPAALQLSGVTQLTNLKFFKNSQLKFKFLLFVKSN